MQSHKVRQSNSLVRQRQSPLPFLETKPLLAQAQSQSPQHQQLKMHQLTFYQRLRMYYKSTHSLTPKPWVPPSEEQATVMRLISIHEVMKAQKKQIQLKTIGTKERVFQHKRLNTDSSKIQTEFVQKTIKFNLKLSQNEPINVIRSNSFGPWDSLN